MTKKKDEPLNESYYPSDILAQQKVEDNVIVIPDATNEMGAQKVFDERTEYRNRAYPYNDEEVPTPIDIWYNRGLYGKVDTDYNPVFVDEKFLKKLPSEEGDVFVLNFVADAFADLQNYMHVAANEGKIFTSDTKFLTMEPKRGWTSVQNRYYEHVSALYEGFANTFLESGTKKEELLTFKDFMRLFQSYLKTIQPDFPFTRTGFITSQACPITTTGIVIELDLANHGNDRVKYEDYIGDPNFVFYTRAARRFGFWVDKNAPWRLIADLKSDVMQKYMSRYPEEPIEPPLSGSQPQLPEPCMPEWFGNFKNQKVEFKINGTNRIGYIADLLDCNDPRSARFKIQEVVDELEIDLIQSSDLIIPQATFVEGPQSALNADKTQAQIINIAAPDPTGTGQVASGGPSSAGLYGPATLQDFRWLTAPLPETRNNQSLRETVEKYYDVGALGTSFARRTGLGAFKPQPIKLSAAASHINGSPNEIQSYNWSVLEDTAAGSDTPFYLTPDTSGGPISPQDLTGAEVYFVPIRSGQHTIQLRLKDQQGNIRNEVFTLSLNVCTIAWEDTANKFALTPGAAEAFGPAWIYSKLKAEIAAVWDEWNQKADEEYDNWLEAVRNIELRSHGMQLSQPPGGRGAVAVSQTIIPRELIPRTNPHGMGSDQLFPFPFKKQKQPPNGVVGGYPTPELARSIGSPFGTNGNHLCTDGSSDTDQLPQTGELEFLRPRLGWDIVGKYKLLTAWIKYVTSNADGSKVLSSPRLVDQERSFGADPLPSWLRLLVRAEIGPNIYDAQSGDWRTLPFGTQPCLHQFVYNQWQARAASLGPAAYGTENNNKYIFHPPPVFGSCETKIERYELGPPTPASDNYPVKNYPFRNGDSYQAYRVPRTANLGSLSTREKGLDDDQMGDLFGGTLADLFEIILVVSSQLLGGADVKELTANEEPPITPSRNWISPNGYYVALSREPFSGMGIVPFYWYQYQRSAQGVGATSAGTAGIDDSTNLTFAATNYRSDFVIKKIDFRGAYRRILGGRQWNDGTPLNGKFTPYEKWRTMVYRRAGETYAGSPQRYLFVDDPRFRETIIPWQAVAPSPASPSSNELTPSERDEVVRYLISLDPGDTQRYADMLLFVLSVASDNNCGLIEVPSTTIPYDPATEEPPLNAFETEPFYYQLSDPQQPIRTHDWKLSHGDVIEYLRKREDYARAIFDHPRLLREWELRKNAHDEWQRHYARWLTLPRLSFGNLYLHHPPTIDSPGEYIRSFEADIPILENYTLDFYNSYVSQNRILVTRELSECGDGVTQTVHRREMISNRDFHNTYDELFWLRFYFALRLAECNRILTLGEERALIEQIENLYSTSLPTPSESRLSAALEKIAIETNGVYESSSTPITQGHAPTIVNKFKTQTAENSLTLRDLYGNVLPDGSFES